MNTQVAVTLVATPAPGVKRQAESASDVAGNILSARAPLVFPSHQFGRNTKLLTIDILSRLSQLDVLQKEIQGIHVQLGRRVFQCGHRNQRGLRMIRSAPCSRRAHVGSDGSVFFALIWNVKDIWDGRHPSATRAACPPGLRLPTRESAIFFCGYFDSCECRRPGPGNFQLGVALEHHADWLAACSSRELRSGDVPSIGGKFAAETSADMILFLPHVCRRNLQWICHLARNSRDVLGREMNE